MKNLIKTINNTKNNCNNEFSINYGNTNTNYIKQYI